MLRKLKVPRKNSSLVCLVIVRGLAHEGTRREHCDANFDPHTYHFHYLIIARLALVLMTKQYKVQIWLSLNVTRIYWVMA